MASFPSAYATAEYAGIMDSMVVLQKAATTGRCC
jgi:hypothetical protein